MWQRRVGVTQRPGGIGVDHVWDQHLIVLARYGVFPQPDAEFFICASFASVEMDLASGHFPRSAASPS
jgi:hypothetical protein